MTGSTLGVTSRRLAAGVCNLAAATAMAMLVNVVRSRRNPTLPPSTSPRIQIDFGFSSPAAHISADLHTATPGADDWIAMARQEVGELARLADHLYGLVELARHEPEVTEETFVRLDDLRWLLGNYVLNGGRIRRLCQLPGLLNSINAVNKADVGPLEPSVSAVRTTATELLQRITSTNAVTADWLVAHRVALPDLDFLDSNALLGRYGQLAVEPTSISGDPLYLLTSHLHDILETVDGLGAVDHPVLDVLETQLSTVLSTVGAEIASAQAFNTALITLARLGRSAEAA
jgi:hypothetical protein